MIVFCAIELIYSICLLLKKEYLGGIRYVNYS